MLTLRSSTFSAGGKIPIRFTQYGESISPSLEWTCDSAKVREFAILCVDPDAPKPEPVVHWLIYGMNSGTRFLPAGLATEKVLSSPISAFQGQNTSGEYGYMGPKPPKDDGPHRYFFKLYALDQPLNAEAGLTKVEFLKKVQDHILAETELIGTYQYEGIDLSPGFMKKAGSALQDFFAR